MREVVMAEAVMEAIVEMVEKLPVSNPLPSKELLGNNGGLVIGAVILSITDRLQSIAGAVPFNEIHLRQLWLKMPLALHSSKSLQSKSLFVTKLKLPLTVLTPPSPIFVKSNLPFLNVNNASNISKERNETLT